MNGSGNLLLTAVAVLLVGLSVGGKPTHAGARYTSAFENGTAQITTIALLPPEAEIAIRKVDRDKAMVVDSAHLEDIAAAITRARFEQAGYQFRSLTDEDLNADPQLQDLADRANRRFETEYAKLLDEPRLLKERSYGMGEEAVMLADYLGIDAIAFQKVEAEAAGGGRMGRAFSVRGARGHARVDLTIVNGATGDFEANFSGTTRGVKAFKLRHYPDAVISKAARLAYARVPWAPDIARRSAATDEPTVITGLDSLLTDSESTSLD